MEFLVLGPLQVRAGDQPREIGAGKPRSLLGVLLVNANQVVSADRLLEEVWGDRQPAGGTKTLQYHISKLRDALEPDRDRGAEGGIVTEAGGYVLRVEPDQIDTDRFEMMAREGGLLLAEGDVEIARKGLSEALGLWRGAAFEDFRYDSFAQGEIARLEELRLGCLEHRIAADLELGHHSDVVAELRELTTRYPLRERLWGQLMLALYRSDQQAEALRAYQTARTVLGEELGIEPNTALQRLEEQILLHELPFEPPQPEPPQVDDLPARTSSFIGRRDDIADVRELIGERRLVTLTGFAGIGKTSLAVETARHLVGSYSDGVWLAELAPLTDPSGVVGEIAVLFDVRAHPTRPLLEAVVDVLADRSVLLVVDNCEHLLAETAGVIDTLLAGCPELRVLATSREPMQLPGEQLWPVPPLDTPTEDELPVEVAAGIEAVQLFVDRARQSQPGFKLDHGNVETVVAVCRRLDGIPLAIELAAARLRVLSPQELLKRLDNQFAILTTGGAARPERHRTLRAAIEWSYHLLDEPEQVLIRRLAVFRGGFTLAAAEDICSHDGIEPGTVLDGVGHLLDASLLTVREGEPRRYGMLESVHQYAEERLAASGEEGRVRDRHADYFERLGPLNPALDTAEWTEAVEQLATEQDNLHSALAWAIRNGDSARALRLAARLRRHWNQHGQKERALYWLPRVLELADATPTMERAMVLYALGASRCYAGRHREAVAIIDELNAIAERLDNTQVWGFATTIEAMFHDSRADLREGLSIFLERLPVLRDDPNLSLHLGNIAWGAVELGQYDVAVEAINEMEKLATSQDHEQLPTTNRADRGALAFYQGDLTTAHQLLTEEMGELRRRNLLAFQLFPLRNLAQVALAAGHAKEAEDWAHHLIDIGRPREMAAGHTFLARAALAQQRLPAARQAAMEGLDIAVDTDDALALTWVVATVGQIAWATGNAADAALLHAGAQTLRTRIGVVHPAPRARELEHEYMQTRNALGTDAFNTAWKTGASLSKEELVGEARRVLTALPVAAAE